MTAWSWGRRLRVVAILGAPLVLVLGVVASAQPVDLVGLLIAAVSVLGVHLVERLVVDVRTRRG